MGDNNGLVNDLRGHLPAVEDARDEVARAEKEGRDPNPEIFRPVRWNDLATEIRRAIERLDVS